MSEPLRVLIVEDRPDDAELVARHLRDAGFDAVWERVDTEAGFVAKLHLGFDLIIADYDLPQFSAPRALEILKGLDLDIPFIVVSGTVGEDAAVAAMRSGAHDYVFKGNLSRLRPAVEREVRAAAERKAARVAQGDHHRRLRSIFDSALDAVVTMDAGGLITDWNPMAETIFGWPKSEAVGKPVAETIIPHRYRGAHTVGLRRFLSTGTGPLLNTRLELVALHRDGHEFPIELSISATSSGGIHDFSAFVRDITERRRAEEALGRLASIVATSTDAIMAVDLNGSILTWNAGAERMYDYSAEEIIGSSISMIVPDARSNELTATLDLVRRGDPIEQVETVRKRKDGSLVEVSISFSPLTDANGMVIATTGIHRDISAAKRAAQALRASEERYRRIVETAFEGVWIFDGNSRTTFVNRRMADMLGYVPDEMLGKPVQTFMDAEAQLAFVANGDLRERARPEHEFRLRRKDGSELWVLIDSSPELDTAGITWGRWR